jgi:phage recombination protein Bet
MSNLTIRKDLTNDQIDLLTRTICKGADKNELDLFIAVASRTGLDPLTKQIYAIKRWDSIEKKNVMTFQVGIDGLRLIAERTGQYEGQTEPQWCGEDGVWKDVWLANTPPAACRVGVYRKGFKSAVFGVVKFSSFVQKTKEGNPTSFWAKMPEVMIAKVAESHALRKAFPQEMSGLHVEEETAEMEHLIDLDQVPDAKPIQIKPVQLITKAQYQLLVDLAQRLGMNEQKMIEGAGKGKENPEDWDLTFFASMRLRLETAILKRMEQEKAAKEAEEVKG